LAMVCADAAQSGSNVNAGSTTSHIPAAASMARLASDDLATEDLTMCDCIASGIL
jgi:hypothetical protein